MCGWEHVTMKKSALMFVLGLESHVSGDVLVVLVVP